jgi:sarcosine oxidase subunit alpha
MTRLPAASGQVIDRERPVRFECEGRAVTGFQGDTVASALCAAGQTVFSRSFKYHRPRGLLCVSGKCPNCLMNVDGVPNVRACTEQAREGMRVQSQNRWPSLKHDFLSVVEWFDFLLPVGFYYKMFHRPRWAWKFVEPVLRRIAGLGRIADDAPDDHYEHLHLHCDIAVVGGGPAGMSAALSAAEAGAEVFLIDEQAALGGHLRGLPEGETLIRQIEAQQRIRVFRQALAFGAYEGGLLAVRQGNSLIHVRARKLVVATGSHEYPGSFEGNDLPGVMLASGVRNLLRLYGIRPGQRAVICAPTVEANALSIELKAAGVEVHPVLPDHQIVKAIGSGRVRAAVLASPSGEQRELPCDLIVLSTRHAGALELLRQSGVRCEYDESLGQMTPREHPLDVFSAGRVTGIRDEAIEVLQGRRAGLEASGERGAALQVAEQLSALAARYMGHPAPGLLPDTKGQFVCFCEDVQQKDITQAIAEGFSELETLKRYSTATMGPCQGRMCLMTAAGLCARQTGRTLVETGATTARPPVQPITLGVLAGAHHEPVKLTPMHYKHVEAGATLMNMGEWKRPLYYTSPQEEWHAVRERVGLIDVSTLGKIEVKGPDTAALLDSVYTHSFSTLKPGRIRYGLICNDEGIIVDDGTVSRLAEDHYFLTTTTGNVDFVERWLTWTVAGGAMNARVANVTGDYAAVNVAGPKARATLAKLTATGLSSTAFPYMACRRSDVAGVPALLLRIGFVGETGWEIHYPASYGEYLWDALLEAGAEFDIRPFGVEAQRILRLEKKHVIIGHDTDALSNPFEADMAWCVKFDKSDYYGRARLEQLRDQARAQRLVGFVADWSEPVDEGSAVIVGARPAGRVTSCKTSPHLGKPVGMAWVPANLAQDGSEFEVRSHGRSLRARVTAAAFYDPDGKRLRE